MHHLRFDGPHPGIDGVPELLVTGSLKVASDAADMGRGSSASYRARRQERERQCQARCTGGRQGGPGLVDLVR